MHIECGDLTASHALLVATPDAEGARERVSRMDAKLFSAFRHLSDAIRPHDRDAADRLRRALDQWEPRVRAGDGRASGILVAFCTCLEQACREGDLNRIAALVAELSACEGAIADGGDFSRSGRHCGRHLDLLDRALRSGELQRPSETAVTIALPGPDADRDSQTALADALARIRAQLPDYYEELRACVTNIFIVRSDCINAGSSYLTFGIVYLKELQADQDWTAYFEHVVHEAAHHALFAIMGSHRLFAEGQADAKYASPFRSELRPLDAIFHAAFVLSRLCDALEVAGLGAFIRTYSRTAKYNYDNPKGIPAQFYDAYDVLAHHARLTDQGREVLDSAKAVVDSHR